MRMWYGLPKEERELMESYSLGEFRSLKRQYHRIRRKYFAFGIIPLGRQISEEDRTKLEALSDKMVSFHGTYSSQHPERIEVNTNVLETRFEIDKMLGRD